MTHRTRVALVAAGVTLFAVLWAVSTPTATAAPAGRAQTCTDSFYGCPPTTPPPGIQATCTVSQTAAVDGDLVTATLSNVPPGTHAQLLFDGSSVGEGDAGANGSLTISFTVPPSTPPGNHSLVFVGAGFQCDPTGGAGLTIGVLGEQLSQSRSSDTPRGIGGSSSGGIGGLARTGIEVALFLAIALVLVLVGYLLVQTARRRRRRIARRRNRVDHLIDG